MCIPRRATRLSIVCASALFVLACSDDPTTPASDTSTTDTSDATTTDTSTTDTSDTSTTDTADTSDGKVDATFTLVDFLSSAPLEGAELALDGVTETTDAEGKATLRVTPGADLGITVTGDGFRDHYFYLRARATETSYTYTIATDTTITAMETLFSPLEVDDTKGLLSISVREAGTGASIPGMTITTDAAADLNLIFDSASGTGLSPGNVTLEGSSSTAILVNVEPGDVTPSFAHPSDYACDVGPMPVDVPAGAYVIATYECAPTTISFDVVMRDFLSGNALEGATVEIGDETATTDADGEASFMVAKNTDVMIKVTGDGFRDHYMHLRAGETDVTWTFDLATDNTIAAISTILGLTVDDTKGILTTAVRAAGAINTQIPGMTITSDGDPLISLVLDASSTTGINVGATTLEGSASTVIQVNVTAGDVTPTFSHPWGYTCDIGPSPVDVPAGSYVIALYTCDYEPMSLTLVMRDFLSGTAIEGLSVAIGGETETTDADGEVTFELPPNADVMALVTGEGTRDHYLHLRTPAADATITYTIATDTTISAMEALLSPLTVDDTKGLLSVSVRDAETGASIPGMTITADATSQLTLVFDTEGTGGVSAGNVTLEGSSSTAILVNVDAGEVTPTFAHDDGYVCDDGPWPVTVPAGAYVIATYRCSMPPAAQ